MSTADYVTVEAGRIGEHAHNAALRLVKAIPVEERHQAYTQALATVAYEVLMELGEELKTQDHIAESVRVTPDAVHDSIIGLGGTANQWVTLLNAMLNGVEERNA